MAIPDSVQAFLKRAMITDKQCQMAIIINSDLSFISMKINVEQTFWENHI